MKNITLTPEEQLVLAAMKLKPTAEELARMERLVAEVQDWNYCTRLAIDRGIGPLLNHKIPMLGNSHLIPADAQARLQQSYLRTLARSMRLYEAFREVGTALNEAGIKFVALKGVYLAEALYEDIGLRLFSDIDLLVAEEDGERSLEVLREVGYKPLSEHNVYSSFFREHMEIVHYLPMLKGDVSVEIHIKLHKTSNNYKFNIPLMLADTIHVNIADVSTFVLNPLDLIIHLCMHADKHFRQGQIQFTSYIDILNFITINKIDKDSFLNRCKLHECEKSVLVQLTLLETFCELEYTKILRNKFTSDTSNVFNSKLFIRIFRGEKVKSNQISRYYDDIKRIGNLFNWIRYIFNIIHPDKTFMVNRYKIKNPANYRVYYIVRYYQGVKSLFKKTLNH